MKKKICLCEHTLAARSLFKQNLAAGAWTRSLALTNVASGIISPMGLLGCSRVYGVLLLIPLAAIATSGQGTTDVRMHPVLRLEKPKYVLGESVRFWVGVRD